MLLCLICGRGTVAFWFKHAVLDETVKSLLVVLWGHTGNQVFGPAFEDALEKGLALLVGVPLLEIVDDRYMVDTVPALWLDLVPTSIADSLKKQLVRLDLQRYVLLALSWDLRVRLCLVYVVSMSLFIWHISIIGYVIVTWFAFLFFLLCRQQLTSLGVYIAEELIVIRHEHRGISISILEFSMSLFDAKK